MKLSQLLDSIIREPFSPRMHVRIPQERVLGEVLPETVAVENEHYVELRLSELHLEHQREWMSSYLPVVTALLEFRYGSSEDKRIPLCVGSNLVDAGTQPFEIQFINTRLIGPVPYIGGDLTLFLGLSRVQTGNATESLLAIMEVAAKAIALPSLAATIQMAEPLVRGMEKLLRHSESKVRVAMRAEMSPTGVGLGALRGGYIAHLREPTSRHLAEKLWVKEGQLYAGDQSALSKVTDTDYCLVRVEVTDSRKDFASLPCFACWKEVEAALAKSDMKSAKAKYAELLHTLVLSDDLTERQRNVIIDGLHLKYTAAKTRMEAARKGTHSLRVRPRSAKSETAVGMRIGAHAQMCASLGDDHMARRLTELARAAAKADRRLVEDGSVSEIATYLSTLNHSTAKVPANRAARALEFARLAEF